MKRLTKQEEAESKHDDEHDKRNFPLKPSHQTNKFSARSMVLFKTIPYTIKENCYATGPRESFIHKSLGNFMSARDKSLELSIIIRVFSRENLAEQNSPQLKNVRRNSNDISFIGACCIRFNIN